MVDEVGRFRDQARAILLDRRQHGLDRLLAELLGAMRHALVEEPARIRGMSARLRAFLHALFEIAEGEVRHRSCSALAYHLRPPPQIGESSPGARPDARRPCFTFRPGRLAWLDASPRARFLVRFC